MREGELESEDELDNNDMDLSTSIGWCCDLNNYQDTRQQHGRESRDKEGRTNLVGIYTLEILIRWAHCGRQRCFFFKSWVVFLKWTS
jgi:hypothetical protein